jgi:hypothetical protein
MLSTLNKTPPLFAFKQEVLTSQTRIQAEKKEKKKKKKPSPLLSI